MDPDPRIQLRIWLLSSVTLRIQFLSYFFLITYLPAHYLQYYKFNFFRKGKDPCRIRIGTSDRIRILEAQKHVPQHCTKEFKRIGPTQRHIFKRRIKILETTMKRRHLNISLAVYSLEREEPARHLPISKEYSSGTSTYPHLKAIPIGYALKLLLRSSGAVSKDRDRHYWLPEVGSAIFFWGAL